MGRQLTYISTVFPRLFYTQCNLKTVFDKILIMQLQCQNKESWNDWWLSDLGLFLIISLYYSMRLTCNNETTVICRTNINCATSQSSFWSGLTFISYDLAKGSMTVSHKKMIFILWICKFSLGVHVGCGWGTESYVGVCWTSILWRIPTFW